MNLKGKAALVTGGAKRVGRAIVLELARAGCDVAIHYRSSAREAEDLVAELAGLGRASVAVQGDLNDPASWPAIIRRVVDAFGRLDILVNNASAFPPDALDTIDRFDPAFWEMMLRVNLTAPVGLCHHARKYLEAGEGGRVVNLCDIAAERPYPSHLAYCTSKAALKAVTQALARALAPKVTVCGVSPGIAVFPERYSKELRSNLVRQVPLGREGTPEEVAGLVRFLVESGDYVTGEIIRIDGGRGIA